MQALRLTGAALTLALMLGAPLAAQMAGDPMKSDTMKMSKADTAAMTKCQAMTHDAMMKNKKCADMMKAHSEMTQDNMKTDAMKK